MDRTNANANTKENQTPLKANRKKANKKPESPTT